MALPTLRPLSFGEILDGAFNLYRRHFATFILTALVPTAVVMGGFVLLGGSLIAAMTSNDEAAIMGAMLGTGLLVIVLAVAAFLVMYGALGHQAAQAYTGQPSSVGDGLRAGLKAAPRLLGASIVAWVGLVVAIFGVMLVAMLVSLVLAALGPMMAALGGVVMFLLVFVVTLAAISLLFGVLPAIVVENAGPLRSLERSVELARGAVGRVLGLMLVTLLITYLPMMAVMMFTGGFAQIANPNAMPTPTPTQFITQQVLGMAVGLFTGPFMVSVMVLLYFDRRVRTEALDVQMMTDRLALAGD
jgi:hypothetical protein